MRHILMLAVAVVLVGCSGGVGDDAAVDALPPVDAAAQIDAGADGPPVADAQSCLGPTQVCHDAAVTSPTR